MLPFKDHGVVKLERQESRAESSTSEKTVLIDSYRQGVEVNLINYYLRSTKAYISSKGLARTNINERLIPELDLRDLGQKIEISDFTSFEDKTERVAASEVLTSGLVQDDQDYYLGQNSIDGRITVFSDSGKLDIVTLRTDLNERGINSSAESLSHIDTYNYAANSSFRFIDGVEQSLGLAIPGFKGDEICLNPYKEFDITNSFGMTLNYDYITNNEKTYSRGFSFYGSHAGTDSIAFGGKSR